MRRAGLSFASPLLARRWATSGIFETRFFVKTLTTHGIAMPQLGFGTFRMPGGGCQPVVESALELGYRHIDTAAMYQNEEAVGAAIAASGLARNQLHLTTKVWHENLKPEAMRRARDASLEKLGVDYLDLYM